MSNSSSQSNGSNSSDWKQVVIEIVLKIITLGLYHVEKHSKR